MKKTIAILQALMKSGWCARRKEVSDAMIVNQNKGRTSVKAPSSVTEERLLNLKLNSDSEAGIKNMSTSGHVAKPPSSKQRVPRVARASTPLKSTSDTDKSTTAGSSDLTEEDCFCDSGSDLELVGDKLGILAAGATQLTMPASIALPPGLAPPRPPGLEAPPGLEVQGIQNNLKAAPFAQARSQEITPSSAQKMSVANGFQGTEDILASNPGEFVGAMQHLSESMAQVQGALAQWENYTTGKDAPALKSAAQANTDTYIQAARLLSEVSSMLGASSTPSTASTGQTVVVPNAARSGTVAPPWRLKASLEQKSSQRSCNLHNSPKQGRRQVGGTPAVRKTADEMSEDSLRTNLQEVDQLPAERVLIVRKIASLGLESPSLLKDHFAQYGVVERVFVSPTRVKKTQQPARLRPAGMGFILMSSMEDVTTILNFGREQIINGVVITVHPCEPRDGQVAKQEDKDQDKMFKNQAGETKGMRFQ